MPLVGWFRFGLLGGIRLAGSSDEPAAGRESGGVAFFASRLLVARVSPCSAGPRCWSRITAEPGEHVFHLLLGIGVVDLEVVQVVEHAADPRADALVAIVDPAGHLALNHRPVVEVVALLGRQPVGLGQGAHGVVDRRDRLLLHGEDARDLLAQLAPRVVELAGRVFLGDDPQANLAALADVRPLDRVEIAGVGIEGDDGPHRELERRQLPVVSDLLVLDESVEPPARPCSSDGPEGNGDFRVRLGVAGGEPVDQPRRVQAEVIVEDRRGPGSVASAGTSRSVFGSSITTRGASSRKPRTS